MINRVIYNGKVYYKTADLAVLFDVSIYVMRNRVKKANVGTTLKGFGRMVFVMESDVAKIEVNGKIKVLETEFTADPVKHEYDDVEVRTNESKAGKKDADKTETTPSENKVDTQPENKIENSVSEAVVDNEIEKLQNRHEYLMKYGKQLGVKLHKLGAPDLTHEINAKHLGDTKFVNATVDDVPQMELVVADLEKAVAELEKSPSEITSVNLNVLPETESTLQTAVAN